MSSVKTYHIILCIVLGTYSIADGLGHVSLVYWPISVSLKVSFLCCLFWIITNKLKGSPFLVVIMAILSILPIIIIVAEMHLFFGFFPSSLGDYELHAVYYEDEKTEPGRQNRIEYFTKDYGINNSAEKFEKVTVYLSFFETREELYPGFKYIESYEFVHWIKPRNSP